MRIIFILLTLVLVSCKKEKPLVITNLNSTFLIPKPESVQEQTYGFLFDEETTLQTNSEGKAKEVISQFKKLLKTTPFPLNLDKNSKTKDNTVSFNLVSNDSISSPEGYVLDVNEMHLSLAASEPQGLYRGLQTIKQLLPNAIIAGNKLDSLTVPGIKIIDAPRYEYRGMMLDVARHFFTVAQVKRLIDQIAFYKINTLHLHLTDDQGWRIEIKSWPKLTEIGGSSAVGGDIGGFYTQEDYKEIVSYAKSRFITVIPEIDMPGHTNAALASYAELNCTNIAPEMYTKMRVGFSSLCVEKEITYTFVDDVIREVAAMTPGKYIHLGGDESHSTTLKDYKIFLKRAFGIVAKYDKKVMGWEDIQSAGVDSTYILQHWTSEKITRQGIVQGAKVVLSPAKHAYLDMKYSKESKIGITWAGTIEVDSAYLWNPSTIFPKAHESQILGIESPLWSETVVTTSDLEYLAFPRVIGHAELGWSKSNVNTASWLDYKKRLQNHYSRMDVLGINYYRSPIIDSVFK
ncbi:family 20 glycosylhydrolase [Dokdonia sp. Hel_I_53]|uniref:family 20 glycosylhydrolase n=1 Tax=Dokdonia sp. Hel_I_53 TaxID=1566287 RepID=UPI00119A2626|nr:family 20 glycosylhydrolase [Dokdonia sp. Hel_I_53]TVZ51610.1 hexosaminidase [Dokdonia sp. Hel_I_53]